MKALKEKTIVITGGSRGIGQAIALKFAAAGANTVVLTKDSPAQIKEVSQQIVAAGGKPLVLPVDISDCSDFKQAVAQAEHQFGSLDALVNNTSATCFKNAEHITPEQFDLVMATSVRAAFLMSQTCLPYLKRSSNPHIINISPPINLDPQWFKNYLAFTVAKYAMSMCTIGMASEFQKYRIAVNSLWPKTTIASQTIKDHFSPQVYASSRWPSIMADAAYELILRPSREVTGQFFTDEDLLRQAGVTNFSSYAVDLKSPLMQSLFTPQEKGMLPVSQDLFL